MAKREKLRFRWPGGFRRSLLAILTGNLIYFAIWDWLPEGARHQRSALDFGLVVDLLICAGVYWLSRVVLPIRDRRPPSSG